MSDGDEHSDGAIPRLGLGDGKEGEGELAEAGMGPGMGVGQRQSSPATTISTVGGSHWTSRFSRKGSLDE